MGIPVRRGRDFDRHDDKTQSVGGDRQRGIRPEVLAGSGRDGQANLGARGLDVT